MGNDCIALVAFILPQRADLHKTVENGEKTLAREPVLTMQKSDFCPELLQRELDRDIRGRAFEGCIFGYYFRLARFDTGSVVTQWWSDFLNIAC